MLQVSSIIWIREQRTGKSLRKITQISGTEKSGNIWKCVAVSLWICEKSRENLKILGNLTRNWIHQVAEEEPRIFDVRTSLETRGRREVVDYSRGPLNRVTILAPERSIIPRVEAGVEVWQLAGRERRQRACLGNGNGKSSDETRPTECLFPRSLW